MTGTAKVPQYVTPRSGYHWDHMEPGNKADRARFNKLIGGQREAVKERVAQLLDSNNGQTVAANWKAALQEAAIAAPKVVTLTFELLVDPTEWAAEYGVELAQVPDDLDSYFYGAQPFNGTLAHGAVCIKVVCE